MFIQMFVLFLTHKHTQAHSHQSTPAADLFLFLSQLVSLFGIIAGPWDCDYTFWPVSVAQLIVHLASGLMSAARRSKAANAKIIKPAKLKASQSQLEETKAQKPLQKAKKKIKISGENAANKRATDFVLSGKL